MSFLPDDLKIQTFPCPNCRQYISSEAGVCRFCSLTLTEDIKQVAVERELKEKSEINLKRHKNTLITGSVLLLLGFASIVVPIVQLNYSNGVNINCLTPVFIIGGIVITVKGLAGYRKETRKI